MQVQEVLPYGNLITPTTIISSLFFIYIFHRVFSSWKTPENVEETTPEQRDSQEYQSFETKMLPAKSIHANRQSVNKNNAYRLACFWDEGDDSKFGLFIMRREWINGKWQFNLDYQLKFKTATLDPSIPIKYVNTGLRNLGLSKRLQEEIDNLVQQGNTDPVQKLVVENNTTRTQQKQVYHLHILLANGMVYKYTITTPISEKMHPTVQCQRCVKDRSLSVKDLYAPRHLGRSVCRYLHDNGSINVAGSKSVLEPYVQKLTNEIGEGFMFKGQNLSQEQMGDCIQEKIAWINRSDSGESPQHFAGRISLDKKTFEIKKTFIDELYEGSWNCLGLTEQEVTQLSEMNDRARLGHTDNDQKTNQESPFLTIKFSDEIHSLIEEKNLTIEKVHTTENHSYLILSDGTLLWAGNCWKRNNENGLWQIALRGDSPYIRPADPNQKSHLTPEIHTSDMWEVAGELIYLINGHALYYGPHFLRKHLNHPQDQSGTFTVGYFTNLLDPGTKIPIHGSIQNSHQEDIKQAPGPKLKMAI